MEQFLKDSFGETVVKNLHSTGGGCISDGCAYQVGSRKMFIKQNREKGADIMFEGEFESLRVIRETNTVMVPEPIKVCKNENSDLFIMEYVDMNYLSKHQATLGEKLAELHQENIDKLYKKNNKESVVGLGGDDTYLGTEKFGFHTPTCCGFVPLDNTWSSNWVEFYARNRLKNKIDLILESHGDRELIELWSELQLKLDRLFKDIVIYPSLLHGDLWSGNAGETKDGPVIFDPASFYGHHEFELSITNIFGGFNHSFFKSYHSRIPKSPGFAERHELYKCFHYLNHWNHFGSGYRGSSLSTMRKALTACNRLKDEK